MLHSSEFGIMRLRKIRSQVSHRRQHGRILICSHIIENLAVAIDILNTPALLPYLSLQRPIKDRYKLRNVELKVLRRQAQIQHCLVKYLSKNAKILIVLRGQPPHKGQSLKDIT